MNLSEINEQIHLFSFIGFRQGKTSIDEPWALYWDWADGSEGGMIDIIWLDNRLELGDYDGAFILPTHVRESLKSIGVDCSEIERCTS